MPKGGRISAGGVYYAREARLRRVFLASRGELEPLAIQRASECRTGEAQLVACARRLAPLDVLAAYEAGRLTLRQLWRCCEYAGEPDVQRAVAGVPRETGTGS